MTLRARLRLLVTFAALLLALGSALSGYELHQLLQQRQVLVDTLDPAALQVDDLFVAYLDQETGVRGYALSGERTFLQPYDSGLLEQRSAEQSLGPLVRGAPQISALLAAAERAGGTWQARFARPEVANVEAHGAGSTSEKALIASKQLFDQVRTAFGNVDTALVAARAADAASLDGATETLVGVLIGFLVLVVLAAGMAVRSLRRWVTEPVAALGGSARQVAAGDLRHAIEPAGPPEIRELGADVESMRERIVAELSATDAARAELAERNLDLLRSNEELEQFAYVASHDLQEPLRKVTSFVQLLERRYAGRLDARADQYIDYAVDGARRMQQLITDLLAFSRVGRTTGRFVEVEMASCVAAALADLGSLVEESGARVEVGPLPAVSGDRVLLTSLWQNLIGNSLKFRSEAAPVVTIAAVDAGDHWTFSVADNGIGIEPRFAERIFVVFQRLHSRESYEGTGIGLALCKKIVEFHGGRIRLDVDYHPGTKLDFDIPKGRLEHDDPGQ